MEIKASFAHATKDLRTMGSQGLTALVRKRFFFLLLLNKAARTYSSEFGHQNLDHNHLQETHLMKCSFLFFRTELWCFRYEQSQRGKDTAKTFLSHSIMHVKHLFIHSSCFVLPKLFFIDVSRRAGFCAAHEGNLFEPHSKWESNRPGWRWHASGISAEKTETQTYEKASSLTSQTRCLNMRPERLNYPEVVSSLAVGLGLTLFLPLSPCRNC